MKRGMPRGAGWNRNGEFDTMNFVVRTTECLSDPSKAVGAGAIHFSITGDGRKGVV
jgi:hypothetical protein